jgi:hypothetical protein
MATKTTLQEQNQQFIGLLPIAWCHCVQTGWDKEAKVAGSNPARSNKLL